jgi:hypothetical protein
MTSTPQPAWFQLETFILSASSDGSSVQGSEDNSIACGVTCSDFGVMSPIRAFDSDAVQVMVTISMT